MPSYFDFLGEFQLIDFLQEHGYPVRNCGRYLQIPALWRNGKDETSVIIYPKDQIAKDFVTGDTFDLKDLIKKVAGISEDDFAVRFAGVAAKTIRKVYVPKIEETRHFDDSVISNLKPNHWFYTRKGIKEDILNELGSGLSLEGKLKNRYVFPIFNLEKKIIGLAGRTTSGSPIKWKLIGGKENWVYPSFLTLTEIKSSSTVWVVESIGDFLALYQNGIKAVIVLFGIEMSLSILNFLIQTNPKKIIIGLNNDVEKNSAGNDAAARMNRKLGRYFDKSQIGIKFPQKKDWFEELI